LNFPKEVTCDFPNWDIGNLLNNVPDGVIAMFLLSKLRSHDQNIMGKLKKPGTSQEHHDVQFSHDVLVM
jgi:hypothetical protein